MWINYNPNPRGRNAGDCSIRAISKACGLTWQEAYLELALLGIEPGDMPSANAVWGALLAQNGFAKEHLANSCEMEYTISKFTRDILENQNANTRAILDQMCNDKIQALRDENNALKLAASQQAQNNVLIGAMQNQTNEVLARTAPIPIPAYQVPAPYNVVPPAGGVPCPGGVV